MVETLKIKLERRVVEEVLRRKRIPYRIEEELREAEVPMMRIRRDTLSKKT
jgi:hypothetical protein